MKGLLVAFLLCAVVAITLSQEQQGGSHVSQGPPHQNQGRARRQVAQAGQQGQDNAGQGNENQAQGNDEDEDEDDFSHVNITSCDPTAVPRLSCQDCRVRQICKPIGIAILRFCGNPYKPYCNNGVCSPIPAEGCAEAN